MQLGHIWKYQYSELSDDFSDLIAHFFLILVENLQFLELDSLLLYNDLRLANDLYLRLEGLSRPLLLEGFITSPYSNVGSVFFFKIPYVIFFPCFVLGSITCTFLLVFCQFFLWVCKVFHKIILGWYSLQHVATLVKYNHNSIQNFTILSY